MPCGLKPASASIMTRLRRAKRKLLEAEGYRVVIAAIGQVARQR
jgi:hypothetical protein